MDQTGEASPACLSARDLLPPLPPRRSHQANPEVRQIHAKGDQHSSDARIGVRMRRMLSRKRQLMRAAATAIFGMAVIASGPASADVDCLPDAVKTPAARPATPHRLAAHRPVRKTVVHRRHAKATGAVVRKTSVKHHAGKPRLRKLAHHAPAGQAGPQIFAATGDTRHASAVAGITEQRAPLLHKVACPTKPVGAPMSVLPGDIIEAANQLPFADALAPSASSEAPAVSGVDAAATAPDTDAGLFPAFPLAPTREPGISFFFPGGGGGGGGGTGGGGGGTGGGGGGGGQPPTVFPDQPTSPFPPTNPTDPTYPTDGQPPILPGVEPPVPVPPGVFNPPGEPEPPGWTPPGGGGNPPGGGGVPEPATWGLMIIGFGLAGARLRRLRKAATTH